jgi:hypothetical protein
MTSIKISDIRNFVFELSRIIIENERSLFDIHNGFIFSLNFPLDLLSYNVMSSSTVSRYRESSALTSPSKIYDQNNSSFAEDYALDAIAKEVCIHVSSMS